MEKEVFDLDFYSYNQTLVTSNVDTNFSSVTTKRRKIWGLTNIKLKRQLQSSLKPICKGFIGEPVFDAGGPVREFFALYFDAATRNIMQGTSSSFTLLHDVKEIKQW